MGENWAENSDFVGVGIDLGTSRMPGKCLSHYTTVAGSQILKFPTDLCARA